MKTRTVAALQFKTRETEPEKRKTDPKVIQHTMHLDSDSRPRLVPPHPVVRLRQEEGWVRDL